MYVVLSLLCWACTGQDTPESEIELPEPEHNERVVLSSNGVCPLFSEEVVVEEAIEAATEAANESLVTDVISVLPHQHIQFHNGEAILVDEFTETAIPLNASMADGIRLNATQSIVALDGVLYLLNDDDPEQVYSPINDVLPVPVQRMEFVNDTLWLLGAGRLFRWSDGRLSEVGFGDAVVLDIERSSEGLVVLMPDAGVLSLQGDTVHLESVEGIVPSSIAATLSMGLLMSDGSREIERYHNATRTHFEVEGVGNIQQIRSNVGADPVWIQGDGIEGSVVYNRGEVCTLEAIPEGEWLDVDALGRLITLKDNQLIRHSIGKPVGVVGLLPNERLDVVREVFFVPTLQSSMSALSVWVGTERIDVNSESGSTILNPERFSQGTHVIRMVSESADDLSVTELPFVIAELQEAKWSDVEPIYADNCSGCHSEGSLIPLYNAELWRQNIDPIIDEVSAQTMPVGGSPLSETDILIIRGWKQGGFQE